MCAPFPELTMLSFVFYCFLQKYCYLNKYVNQCFKKEKTRRSGLSAGALRMPDTSEVAGDFSPARSLTPQVRKL